VQTVERADGWRYGATMSAARTGDERTVMEFQLEAQRSALATLLGDLSEAEARARLVPSSTTPLGLVTHATFVEQVWFHHRVAGMSREQVGIPESVEESFVLQPQDTVSRVQQRYLDVCDSSRSIAAEHELDDVFDWRGTAVSLRFIYAHLLTELARHAGQGDILVEQLRARRASRVPGA
jgi:hypothetical protein